MSFRYVVYFLILLIFSLFTVHYLTEAANNFEEVSFNFSETLDFLVFSWVFASISIFSLSNTRHMTEELGETLLQRVKMALKFNLYTIQVLVFLLWEFTLNFVLSANQDIHVDDDLRFLVTRLSFSILYGILVVLLLNGLTVFKFKNKDKEKDEV